MSWWQKLAIFRGSETTADPAERASALRTSDPDNPAEPFQLEVTDVLDLHTFAPRETVEAVAAYLEEVRAKGFPSVRIIHGKGKGVQRRRVHSLLARTPFVASFQEAPAEAGGWGATLVWFSRPSP